MPENPHDSEDLRCEDEKLSEEKENERENDAPGEDQKRRSYYYDDAHGYEIYQPDESDGEEN